MKKQLLLTLVVAFSFPSVMTLVPVCHAQMDIFQAAGPNPIQPDEPQSIQSTVDAFRAKLGEPNNGNNPGPISGGRREINWDGGGPPVNDTTAPVTPFDVFLNTRGARFTTPGTGLSQATPDGLAVLFSNSSYSRIFSTFSPLRLFTPAGSNITEVLFFLPGINPPPLPGDPSTPATVRGFGAVFTDVDRPDGSEVDNEESQKPSTLIEYFDAENRLLFRGIVPSCPGSSNMSFFGIVFKDPIIARVQIKTGNTAPGPDDGGSQDIVVMDDFFYGEPQPQGPEAPGGCSVATDKTQYNLGEAVSITGSGPPSTAAHVIVRGPIQADLNDVVTNSDGSFATSWDAGGPVVGEYTVEVGFVSGVTPCFSAPFDFVRPP